MRVKNSRDVHTSKDFTARSQYTTIFNTDGLVVGSDLIERRVSQSDLVGTLLLAMET